MFAFGISTRALLFPYEDLSWSLLGNIFLPAYFIMSGDDYSIRETIMGALNSGLTGKLKFNQKIFLIINLFGLLIKATHVIHHLFLI